MDGIIIILALSVQFPQPASVLFIQHKVSVLERSCLRELSLLELRHTAVRATVDRAFASRALRAVRFRRAKPILLSHLDYAHVVVQPQLPSGCELEDHLGRSDGESTELAWQRLPKPLHSPGPFSTLQHSLSLRPLAGRTETSNPRIMRKASAVEQQFRSMNSLLTVNMLLPGIAVAPQQFHSMNSLLTVNMM
jgi:hypothetical protein